MHSTPTAAANDLVLITSEREAIAAFGADSAITKACQAIYTRAKAVIVACGVAKVADAAEQTSAIIGGVLVDGKRTGLQALIDGKSRYNAQPRLLVTPKHSATLAVGTALVALADKLRGLAIIDGPGTTDEAAMAYAAEFGAKRAFMADPGVKYWDTTESATVDAPASAWVAGLFAWTDNEYGFWASPSNKEFVGITGTTRSVEFLDGDETCRANLLNNANIATIIRDDGYRLWGNTWRITSIPRCSRSITSATVHTLSAAPSCKVPTNSLDSSRSLATACKASLVAGTGSGRYQTAPAGRTSASSSRGSGWTTTVECNGGKKGKAKAKGKKTKQTKPLRTVDVAPA